MEIGTERDRLLCKIAKAYYDHEESQKDIAIRFGISRVKVCRLLKQAKEEGIVTIHIRGSYAPTADIELKLAAHFGIKEVIVAQSISPSPEDVSKAVGMAAAVYCRRAIQGNEIIGLSWGTSLLAFVKAIEPYPLPDVKIVQILGGIGDAEADVHGAELARRMADRFGAKSRILQTPGIVSSPEIRTALLADPQIEETLKYARMADIAFIGIGTPDQQGVLSRSLAMTPTELETVRNAGAVGDVILKFFDRNGRLVPSPIDDRVMGLTVDELKKIPRVVGVASGLRKVDAMRGALLGKYISVLIVDEFAAAALMK
jgi:DNA-binding transcriptional regulator LsrR (DeoR family)